MNSCGIYCNKSHHDHVLLLAMHACCEWIDTYQVYSFPVQLYSSCCISCGPPFTLSTVSEGANNPYTKVHSTYQFSYLLAASLIFLYQTGEKRTRLSYNHGRVNPSHLTVLVKWSLYVARSLTAVLERLH